MSIRQNQVILFGDVLDIINNAITDCTQRFYVARGKKDETEALAMAEAKWQLAEIKLKLVDKITNETNGLYICDGCGQPINIGEKCLKCNPPRC